MARAAITEFPPLPRLNEIPFDADRMRHSVVCETPDGAILYCKGAPEPVLPRCRQIRHGGQTAPLDAQLRETIVEALEAMAEKGLRILAFAMRRLAAAELYGGVEEDMIFLGLVGLEDPPRPEVPGAVRKCHEAGIKVIMVTGDHPHIAVAIAREIGLVQSRDPTIVSGISCEVLRRASLIER